MESTPFIVGLKDMPQKSFLRATMDKEREEREEQEAKESPYLSYV